MGYYKEGSNSTKFKRHTTTNVYHTVHKASESALVALAEGFPRGPELSRLLMESAVGGDLRRALLEAVGTIFTLRLLFPDCRLPSVVEFHPVLLTVRPLEGVVHIGYLVRARVERLQDLPVRERVPHLVVAPYACADVEAVHVRVQEVVRKHVTPSVTAAAFHVNVEQLVHFRSIRVDVVQVVVGPGEVRDLAAQH